MDGPGVRLYIQRHTPPNVVRPLDLARDYEIWVRLTSRCTSGLGGSGSRVWSMTA